MKPVIKHLLFSGLQKFSRGRGIVNHLIASKKIGAYTFGDHISAS